MTDRIQKNLDKFSEKERKNIKDLLISVKGGRLSGLDLKKLKNTDEIFRIRKGKIRIIFKKDEDKIVILAVERRSDNSYKNF